MSRRLPRTLTEFRLPQHSYVDFDIGIVDPRDRYSVMLESTRPVDMMIMDRANLERFEQDLDFVFYGEKERTKMSYRFQPPKKSHWYLVIMNVDDSRPATVVFRALSVP